MRLRYNLIFIPILVIIALLVWFLGLKEKHKQAARLVADRAIINFSDVNAIEISKAESTIRLERKVTEGENLGEPSDWQMTQPVKIGCNPDTFRKIADALYKMEIERDISNISRDQYKEYGFDNPEFEMRLISKNNMVLMNLKVGARNPQETAYYAMFAGNTSNCFLIPLYFIRDLNIKPDDLRDPSAVDIDPSSLASIQISSPVENFTLENKDDTWYVTSPKYFAASPGRLEILFQNISELKSIEFLPSDATNPELGTLNVEVSWKSTDGSKGWLKLHGEDYSKGIYASSSYQPTPFLVEAYIYDRLAISSKVFFRVLLIDVPQKELKKVIVRQPDAENLEIERTGSRITDWRVNKPSNTEPASSADFEKFILALNALEPKESIEPPEKAEDYGIEPVYKLKIEVMGKGKNPEAVIYIGKNDSKGDYYASQDKKSYFTIDKTLVNTFIYCLDRLRKPSEQKSKT